MDSDRKVVELNLDDILPNRFQPRIKFNEQAINELAESIKLHGVIQPIVVRRISDKYEIIAGERRYKASVLAGKKTIPAIITTLDDRNSAEIALIENVQRQDLTPIEEAISYKKILDMGYINQESLGDKLGKKQSTIANKLRLLNLNDEVQEALMENKISERHARSLLKLDEKKQVLMLNRIINERLTVRRTDEEIAKMLANDDTENNQKIKERKGDNIMNNDILKEFNIPTEPIVENTNNEIKNNVETNQLPKAQPESTPTPQPINNVASESNQNTINPGFMDVDKIQNEAKDIVQETPAPADMDALLKPTQTSTPVMEQVSQPLPNQEETTPSQESKFFSMFNFNQEEKNENFVDDVEQKQVNMDFGVPNNNAFNPTENSPAPSLEPNLNIFNPQVETAPESQPETVQPEIAPTPQSTSNIVNENNQNIEQNQQLSENEPTLTSSVQPFSLNDEQEFTNTAQPESNPTPQPVNNEFINPNPSINKSYMMDDSVKFDDDGEIEVQLPSNEPTLTVDMKTVINTVRDCVNQIEGYGYKIETEEMDLQDSYEINFKIYKN